MATDPTNMYAPPAENRELPEEVRAHGAHVWREGGLAVIERSRGLFPERCVVCNARGAHRLRMSLSWHPEWIYALIVFGLVPYLLLWLLLGKSAQLELSLCDEHRRRRTIGLWAAFAGVPLSIAITILSAMAELEIFIYAGIGGMLTGLLLGLLWARVVRVIRMTEQHVSLSTGRALLDSLPPYGGWGQPQGPAQGQGGYWAQGNYRGW